MALTFNCLLHQAGIDPAGVRLLRHRDPAVHHQVYEAAMTNDPRFELYQRSQCAPEVVKAFRAAEHVAGFVADHAGERVFVGVWKMLGQSDEPHREAFNGMRPPSHPAMMFDMTRVAELDDYRGRLVIDWGNCMHRWHQRADRQDKPILEIRRRIAEPPFPGFLAFSCRLSEALQDTRRRSD